MIECDLILLVWNQPEYTKKSVDSILHYTDIPSRLIIVDNASISPAKEYLRTIKPQGMIKEVLLLRNEQNEGYSKGMNRGLKESSAPYACLLNNDILVTQGWLSEMIKIARDNPGIGIINPSSNTTGQSVSKSETIESYAKSLKIYSGGFVEMGWAVGFCMLIKQELIRKIGYLDEVFGIGYFEDQDYSKRAQGAGYICARAKASFVWHAEGASTRRLSHKRQELFNRNAKIFYSRWGKPKRIAYVIPKIERTNFDMIKEGVLKFAKENNWVTIFKKNGFDSIAMPEHSNITVIRLPGSFFYINVIWKLIKKKKRFDKVIWL